jgi:pimeloyl-ACP methyl ester carboxylesterase
VSGPDAAVAASLGRGRVGVVFADDSDDDPCSWTREARRLASAGYATAVFFTGGGIESAEAVTIAHALRAAGAERTVLVGASVGARAVLEAAAERPRGVAGVIALSAERRIGGGGDILSAVRRIRIPVLSVASRGDGLTRGARDTALFHRVIPGRPNRTLILSGRRHGVELLPEPRVRAAIDRFLADVG